MTRCLSAAIFFALAFLSAAPAGAQTDNQARPASQVPALFLSDIHLDPYADPAKVARLNAAPVADWAAILAAPASPTQSQDFAALAKACPVRGIDTPNALWLSSLAALRARAARVRFVTISGDLLAHAFDCKYRTLLPAATHADYVAFAGKTVGYVISSLRAALPGVPLYIAMGNNDSGCADYALDSAHDPFLALTAKIVADALPPDLPRADRDQVLRDFSAGGYYAVPIGALPRTRLIVLDDIYLSPRYQTCAGKPDPAPAAAQLAWLQSQLAAARAAHERVWVLSHIPPGVDLYSTARKLTNVCAGGKAQMFLGSEQLADILASYPDIIRLALFGHTHSDEMRLLTHESSGPASQNGQPTSKNGERTTDDGVPLKIVPSITPVNGNLPTFTLASVDPASATLTDYTVFIASNSTGIGTAWSPEYTFSSAYRQPAFNAASLTRLIAGFQADPGAQTSASQAYLRDYFPGDASSVIKFAWPQYACSMDHDSAASFAACACRAASAGAR